MSYFKGHHMMRQISYVLILVLGVMQNLKAQDKKIIFYHDADYTSHYNAAQSMNMGFNTALSERNFMVQGYTIELKVKDHHGNAKRSKLHMKQFLKDEEALGVLGGLHSPPYLSNLKYINENGIPLLIPWAAAGPITRYKEGSNWVFRVSIDDSKAGAFIGAYAAEVKKCQRPHLLLENTGWGKFNSTMLTQAFKSKNINHTPNTWFDWNTNAATAKIIIKDILSDNSDCIIFVGNSLEGKVFTQALSETGVNTKIPFISHWGITGGEFPDFFKTNLVNKIDLSFIQTCFSFISSPETEFTQKVLRQAYALYPEKLKTSEDIKAPPGFIHAYDLGKIILAALDQIKITGNMWQDRQSFRDALETLPEPIQGLVKTYSPPFEPWSMENRDAHEALNQDNFCMAYYDDDGLIHLAK